MKKMVLLLAIFAMMTTIITGCGSNVGDNDSDKSTSVVSNESTTESEFEGVTADIAINIEGVVTEINGDRYTLDNGKIVIITEETAFETQEVGEEVKIDSLVEVGNFIQGFTMDDTNQEVITALVINHNEEI